MKAKRKSYILRTPPKCSVFSEDPTTKQPYITVQEVTDMIEKHTNMRMSFMLKYHLMEDIVQEMLLQVAMREYDPTKSKASSFVITILQSKLVSLSMKDFSKCKYLCIPDFLIGEDQEKNVKVKWVTQTVVDDVTPEDILLAKEEIELRLKLGKGQNNISNLLI